MTTGGDTKHITLNATGNIKVKAKDLTQDVKKLTVQANAIKLG